MNTARCFLLCIASSFLIFGGMASARSANRTVRLELDAQPDAACNQSTNYNSIFLAKFEEVEVEIKVPKGVSLLGWKCSDKSGVCKKVLVASKPRIETLVVANPDPMKFSGGKLYLNTTKQKFKDVFTPEDTALQCCACPCDFAPQCGDECLFGGDYCDIFRDLPPDI